MRSAAAKAPRPPSAHSPGVRRNRRASSDRSSAARRRPAVAWSICNNGGAAQRAVAIDRENTRALSQSMPLPWVSFLCPDANLHYGDAFIRLFAFIAAPTLATPASRNAMCPMNTACTQTPVRAMPAATTSLMPLATLAIGFVMAMLDVTVVNVALPGIAAQFGVPLTDLVWIADAYTLAFAALLLAAARWPTATGPRPSTRRTGRVHAGLVAVRHGARRPRVDRRAHAAGRGRGAVHAQFAQPVDARLHGRTHAQPHAGRLVRHRGRGRASALAGRRADPSVRLARHLSYQSAVGAGGSLAGQPPHPAGARDVRARSTRPATCSAWSCWRPPATR